MLGAAPSMDAQVSARERMALSSGIIRVLYRRELKSRTLEELIVSRAE